jgi:23S rRNA (pseudouridine1915-N3)-methyltransferase
MTIAAVGRLKAGPERALFDRYFERADRAGRQLGLACDLREIPESTARQAAARKNAEADAILATLPAGAVIVALDEHGKAVDSRVFADRLAGWRDSGSRDVVFLVGGADGLGRAAVDRADLKLGFGAMTWPHQLARIMLAEQLYRAVTILSGHPYHRD